MAHLAPQLSLHPPARSFRSTICWLPRFPDYSPPSTVTCVPLNCIRRSRGRARGTAGAAGWTDLPTLTQALTVQRLTLWEAARLAPLSHECSQLYRSRQSPAQARLLRTLSEGVPGGISSCQLMYILRELYAAVRHPLRTAVWRPPHKVDTQGRKLAVLPTEIPLYPGWIAVSTWPAATSCRNGGTTCRKGGHVVGREAWFRFRAAEKGEELIFFEAKLGKLPTFCQPCWFHQHMVQTGWGSGGYVARPIQHASWGRQVDLIWLNIGMVEKINYDWVLGLLLAVVQRTAFLPLVSRETVDRGAASGSNSSSRGPPVFVTSIYSEMSDTVIAWEDPYTWKPLSDSCDLHIVSFRQDSEHWRETYNAIADLMGDGGKSRARPTVLVLV